MVNYFLSTSVVDSNKFNLNLDPQFSLNLKSVESLNCEFCLQSYTFASNLSYVYMCGSGSVLGLRIRIHKVADYKSSSDPDPQLSFNHGLTINYSILWI